MRRFMAAMVILGFAGFALPDGPAHARLPVDGEVLAEFPEASIDGVKLELRYPEAETMLNRMISEETFWSDAKTSDYNGRMYDEIRLKPVDDGYVPMVTGESDEDIPHEVVADIVFEKMTLLPKYMDGAVAVVNLGNGVDARTGTPYRDTYYLLDLSFFYVAYPQRMYRKTSGDQTFLYFEKVEPDFVDAATWSSYQKIMKDTVEGSDLRSLFGSVLEAEQIYGIFIVGPGSTQTSRVTFVSKLIFGSDAGWLARLGSKMPPVLRAGLQSGFNASVAIAKYERDKRK